MGSCVVPRGRAVGAGPAHELDLSPGVPVALPDPSLEEEARPSRRSRFFISNRAPLRDQQGALTVIGRSTKAVAPGQAGHRCRRHLSRRARRAMQHALPTPGFDIKPSVPSTHHSTSRQHNTPIQTSIKQALPVQQT